MLCFYSNGNVLWTFLFRCFWHLTTSPEIVSFQCLRSQLLPRSTTKVAFYCTVLMFRTFLTQGPVRIGHLRCFILAIMNRTVMDVVTRTPFHVSGSYLWKKFLEVELLGKSPRHHRFWLTAPHFSAHSLCLTTLAATAESTHSFGVPQSQRVLFTW